MPPHSLHTHAPPRTLTAAIAVTATLAASLVAGCYAPKPGEAIEEVCKPENDRKEVSVSGYLTVPKMMTFCSPSCTMHLSATKVEKDTTLSTAFEVGDGNAEMLKLPEKFTAADVKVKDSAGKPFGPGDPVRLTGKLSVNDKLCSMFKPEKIEAL